MYFTTLEECEAFEKAIVDQNEAMESMRHTSDRKTLQELSDTINQCSEIIDKYHTQPYEEFDD